MSKQTAVEWLFDHLVPHLDWSKVEDRELFRKLKEEALAMEKEQIVQAFDGFSIDNWQYDGKRYYNETYHSVEPNEMIDHIGDANKMVFPKDVNGVTVKLGDKIQGIGSLKFQDGFEIDRTPIVTANIQNGKLYFGNLSAESFTLGFKIVESKIVEDDDLTDDEWLIKELKKELSTCIVCDEEKQTHVICMDCIVKTNHEISDEEIEKAKWEHFSDEYADMWSERIAFKLGAVWYREQLKLKTNKL